MKNKLPFLTVLLSVLAFAQTKPLIIAESIKLPKDTLVAKQLVKDLNGFLSQKENTNKENTYVLNEDLLETSILIDEFKEIEKNSELKDDNFYKGYLTNIAQLDKDNFLIQFSYIGIKDNTPLLRASLEVIAKQKDGKFYFMSPLKRNTALWIHKKVGNCVFHFKNPLDLDKDLENKYKTSVTSIDKKLGIQDYHREWYGCNNVPDLLEAIGVIYKMQYNGISAGSMSIAEGNSRLILLANSKYTKFYSTSTHELFHERASVIIPKEKRNVSMICGFAYACYGDWGISWADISKKFKEEVLNKPNYDWLKIYEERYNFNKNKEEHLITTNFINGLICKKAEKEKGISAVKALFASGNLKENRENFFKILEEETGINETNFNEKIEELMKENNLI